MAERLFARRIARELSADEIRVVSGADDPPQDPNPTFCWRCFPNNIGPNGGDDMLYIRD
ncbi:MAG TPA: hypothetical protein VF702_05260 [Allosphingosinicella sp.]|jgi:hypothetical protein